MSFKWRDDSHNTFHAGKGTCKSDLIDNYGIKYDVKAVSSKWSTLFNKEISIIGGQTIYYYHTKYAPNPHDADRFIFINEGDNTAHITSIKENLTSYRSFGHRYDTLQILNFPSDLQFWPDDASKINIDLSLNTVENNSIIDKFLISAHGNIDIDCDNLFIHDDVDVPNDIYNTWANYFNLYYKNNGILYDDLINYQNSKDPLFWYFIARILGAMPAYKNDSQNGFEYSSYLQKNTQNTYLKTAYMVNTHIAEKALCNLQL